MENLGTEWLIDAVGCRSDLLADIGVLRALGDEIVATHCLHVLGDAHWHQFPPPGGVTAVWLLTESHLALHTYPENGVATFNLYCCRPRGRWDWERRLREVLGAAEVRVREVVRGEACNEEAGR